MHTTPFSADGSTSSIHRVLIVDDDPAILFAYSKMLEREGICVDSCDCLLEAVRHIKSHSYLAVITDLRLAGSENTDGLEVVRVLRQEQPATRFILATGYGANGVKQAASRMGVTHYFEKPVMPESIIAIVKDLRDADRANTANGSNSTHL